MLITNSGEMMNLKILLLYKQVFNVSNKPKQLITSIVLIQNQLNHS